MAKGSTPRATSKKKNAPKKKKQQKKEAAPKINSGKAASADTISPGEKPKIDLAAPPAPQAKAPEKKEPPEVKAPVSVKDLIFKKFPEWMPEKPYSVPEPASVKTEARPFLAAGSDEESARIRAILFRKIDLAAPPAPQAKAPEKVEAQASPPAAEPAKPAEAPPPPPEAPVIPKPPAPSGEKETPQEKPAVAAAPKSPPSEEKPPPAGGKAPGEAKAPEKPPEPKKPAAAIGSEKPSKPIDAGNKDTPKVTVTYESTEMKGPAHMDKTMKYLIAGFAFIVLLVVGASYSNMNSYQVQKINGGVEIWQGKFAPMGSGPVLTLPDAQPPKQADQTFSKSEIYPYIANYYLQKADDLLKSPGIPDFEQIRTDLDKAFTYAHTQSLRNTIAKRLASIDLMMHIYKADVAESKGTVPELEAALGHLKKASGLDLDATQAELVTRKMENIRKMLEKASPAAPKVAPSK